MCNILLYVVLSRRVEDRKEVNVMLKYEIE